MSTDAQSSNKRIAKNTILLYIRMFITMVVSLYTSRIVLSTLGVKDFGLYNIVGGIVVFFSILNGALSSSTQRFLNYEIGKGSTDNVNSVFRCSISLHLVLSAIVLVLSETAGLWYLNSVMNVPDGRLTAANWVYQFSIITFIVNLLRVPFNASIIAHEKMDFYAYVSIAEVILKLLIVYLLTIGDFDRLILYASFVLLANVLVSQCYMIFCKRKFKYITLGVEWNVDFIKSMMSFSGWSLFGSIAVVSNQQGVNLILNYFCGVALNAAAGIAGQVTSAMYGFISNFQIAFNPQIVKLYAQDNKTEFFKLINRASKLSFLLFWLISLPVLYTAPTILRIWLTEVPYHTVYFCRIIILYLLVDALNGPLWAAVNATGKLKSYQLLMSGILIMNIPCAYIMLRLGYAPETVWLTKLFFNIVACIVRIMYITIHLDFPVLHYLKNVLLPLSIIVILSTSILSCIGDANANMVKTIAVMLISVLSITVLSLTIGFNKKERLQIYNFIKKK